MQFVYLLVMFSKFQVLSSTTSLEVFLIVSANYYFFIGICQTLSAIINFVVLILNLLLIICKFVKEYRVIFLLLVSFSSLLSSNDLLEGNIFTSDF